MVQSGLGTSRKKQDEFMKALEEMQKKKGTIDVVHSVLKDAGIKHFAFQQLGRS